MGSGISVPGDVSVVGTDDLGFCSMVYPSITTMAQNKYALGELSAEKMMKLVDSEQTGSEVLEPYLIKRQSSAAALS